MGITMTVTGRLGKPERPSFLSRRAHLLTTCEAGGGIPPSSGRALCEADAAVATASRQCHITCGYCRHRLRCSKWSGSK